MTRFHFYLYPRPWFVVDWMLLTTHSLSVAVQVCWEQGPVS